MRRDVIEPLSASLEFIGVAIIVVGLVTASVGMVRALIVRWGWKGTVLNVSDITRWDSLEGEFAPYRRNLLRVIVLGLTFLVAGDIISTASVDRTLKDVGTLAIIVLIREFLSVALDMETTGHWPWQHRDVLPEPTREVEVPPKPALVEQLPRRTRWTGGLLGISIVGVFGLAILKALNLD
ncbi:MAG: DUF1622 domain-containing protein [Solirubrobacterales bacterium]